VRAALPDDADTIVIGPDDCIAGLEVRTVGLGAWGGGGDAPLERAGWFTARAVEEAVRLWREGTAHAIVTAPGEKRALHAAGWKVPGHTELLRDLTGTRDVAMMLASERLRVVLLTTHLALRDALAILTPERIARTAAITRQGLAAGPLPADTVFVRALRGEFDAVLSPFHDVGMTAIKVASFGEAVNVTLGLPVPRTAPDHGTALDIAGTGRADPSSMRAAVRAARAIAARLIG